MDARNIFITGGAGFIGSRLVNALRAKNPEHIIWVFDNLHPQVHGEIPQAPDLPADVHFIRGDVADFAAVNKALKAAQPDLIFHLAAETGTGQSYDEPTRYCMANICGTAHLIEAIRATASCRRVVLAGSRAVYGEGPYIDANGQEYVGQPRQPKAMAVGDFSVPLRGAIPPVRPAQSHAGVTPVPSSIYASSKLMQEYLLCQAGEGTDWGATILRFQNVYGPGQSLRNPYTGVLSIFARQLLAGDDLAIYEDGQIARDFVYVDDVVDALIRAGESDVPHGVIMDIGSGSATTILDAARILMRALGRSDDAYTITGEFRVGDIRHACADITLARQILGWEPQTGIEEGLNWLAQWARKEFQSHAPQ